jgi:pimeloyl-ACP methyl ester carboxylesterase
VDGVGIHFIQERGKGPLPFPLILTHGYPDSFYRVAKIIPILTDPEPFGGRAEDSFDVVVPDLPGYGFSVQPGNSGMVFRANDPWAQLMADKLGYQKFGAHGGDWVSTVTEQLARSHTDSVVAIHLTDVSFGHFFQKPDKLSPDEEKLFQENEQWMHKEAA